MGKNTGMGGNKRKKGKKMVQNDRELQFKEEMQEYGQTVRLLGDSRLEIQCLDGAKRMGHIRGTMRRRVWIAQGDVVLVALREHEKDKCDVILKYTEDEVRKLKQAGEIPESIKLPEKEKEKEEDYGDIVFEGADGSDDEDTNTNKKKNRKNDLPSSDSDDDISEEEKIDIDKI
jgi:translation initiation factor 1A